MTPTPTSSTHQPDPIECRTAFEAWYKALAYDNLIQGMNGRGEYFDKAGQHAWIIWRASWLSRPALAPVAMGEDEVVEIWEAEFDKVLGVFNRDWYRKAFRALDNVADITKRPQAECTDEKGDTNA